MEDTTVVIVGAGPTGLAAARLLTQRGVRCVVLDRWTGVYPQPRAVHLDDEVFRVLGWMGLAERFAQISRPARGLRLLDRDLRVLAEFPAGTACTATPRRTCSTSPTWNTSSATAYPYATASRSPPSTRTKPASRCTSPT
ncbi:FAD-dependent monooxygenase [Actinokineospora soli]|uniref:FAD-dependent monooxygenase n=1 Tax=Actinokineospora soli TaxID=1048753 RepID=A0ABW2TQQ5_9PSEU